MLLLITQSAISSQKLRLLFFLSKLGVVGDLTRTHQDLVIGSKSQPEAPSM